MNDWKKFTDVNGDFQLANFLYKSINDLMKQSLDMGTLLSNDQQKLRAYKEQIKKYVHQELSLKMIKMKREMVQKSGKVKVLNLLLRLM